MMKFETQQHFMQHVCLQQTNQNPDYSNNKYSCDLEHIYFLVHEDETYSFMYSLHYQLGYEAHYFLNYTHQRHLDDTTVHKTSFSCHENFLNTVIYKDKIFLILNFNPQI